jgi:hypothetical protein
MTLLGDEKCRSEKGGLGLQRTFSEPAPWKDEPAHNAIFQTSSAECEGSRARDQHALGPDQEPRSPAFRSLPAIRKEWYRCGRAVRWERGVVEMREGAFHSLRRYRCEGACVGNDAGEVLRGNFGARFGGAMPDGEASYDAQTSSPGRGLGLRGLCGPAKCRLPGDVGGMFGSEKRHKIL